MTNYVVLQRVKLSSRHAPTGKTCHYQGAVLLPPPAELRIVKYSGDTGFYLLHLDAEGVDLTDTYHDTLEDAQIQAQWEFQIVPNEWETINSSDE
jgi:hypothetical protein